MQTLYADVIIPLKFRDSVTYSVPKEMEGTIVPGSIVKVSVVGRTYSAIVIRILQAPPIDPARIKPILEAVGFPPVSRANMDFLRQVFRRGCVQVCGPVNGQGAQKEGAGKRNAAGHFRAAERNAAHSTRPVT